MSSVTTTSLSRKPSGSATLTPLLLATIAAFLLLLAAVLKIMEWVQLSSAAVSAQETFGGELKSVSAVMLVWAIAEIVIATGIVVFRKKAWLWSLATVLFGSLAGYIFVLMVRGEASCGCFGKFSPPPVVMFSVDTLMAIACATLASRSWGFSGFRGVVLTIAGVGSIAGATVASVTTEAPIDETFDPMEVLRELSVMKPVVEVDRKAPHYLVYIYNRNCPACQTHYPGMKAFTDATAAHPSIRGLLLEVDELAKIAEAEGKSLPGYSWGAPPLTLVMRNGQVIERFGSGDTPNPGATFERLTGESYSDLIGEYRRTMTAPAQPIELVPTGNGPNANPHAEIDASADFLAEKQGLVNALRAVPGASGTPRFAAIFDDAPGGVRHLLYAHTNCGVCIEYRREMLDVKDLIDDTLVVHLAMAELLEDDGIPADQWEGVHAALLFDGGELVRWYSEGTISGELPMTIFEELDGE